VISPEDRFRRVYSASFEAMLAYAMRRVEQAEGTRRLLANHHRGGARRERLGDRLRQRITSLIAVDPGHDVPQRLAVWAALARLPEADREVLLLTVWEGLQPREVAEVVGLSTGAVRTRLSRARARLRELVGDDPGGAGHVLDVLTATVPKEGR
jgi:RNA polymerase sigma factor (sigma-70 family)